MATAFNDALDFGNVKNSTFPLEKNIFQGFVTGKNNIVLNGGYPGTINNEKDYFLLAGSNGNTKISIYVLKIQECEGVAIYLILTSGDEYKSLEEIFKLFLEGKYLIGTLEYYFKNQYENGFITNIKSFDEDEYSEIKLHYTKPRSHPGNCAWRTLKWDLFADFVPINE